MTTGLHIFSSAPGIKKRAGGPFGLPYFEMVCLALSAVMWRKLNGPIRFYGDKAACDWLESRGMTGLYESVDDQVLEAIPPQVNQEVFWAGAKLYAIRAEKAPVAMVDTDLIVWKCLEGMLHDPLTVLHREDLIECYIKKEDLKIRPGYSFDPDWDWTVRPCNTAFAYFGDEVFKNRYVEKAIDFMWDNGDYPKEMVSQMVFAEQRLLAMEAVKSGVQIHDLIDNPYREDNTLFTHLWGAKNIARVHPDQNTLLVQAMMNKLRVEDESVYIKLRRLA